MSDAMLTGLALGATVGAAAYLAAYVATVSLLDLEARLTGLVVVVLVAALVVFGWVAIGGA